MRRSPVFLLAFLPLSAHAIVSSASTRNAGLADQMYAWVGRMSGASAVAIGPRTVLTASHVAAGSFVLDGTSYGMTSTAVAPKIKGSKVDLRVVQLASDLPGWYALGTLAKTNATVTMVGYGATGVLNAAGNGYVLTSGGTRRSGTNQVTKHTTYKGFGPTITSMLNRAGESVLAGGDSGGGWFVDGKLVGISAFTLTKNTRKASYGWAKSAYFGSGAIDLTNKSVAAWVNAQIPATRGTVQAVPEPASVATLLVGAVALLRKRRR
ncbi:serine protease [bacterium]|nr:MAG: serine protease [bacterium]